MWQAVARKGDGDFALVKRTDTARDGEIVVALVDNEEATLKYLRKDAGRVVLDPAKEQQRLRDAAAAGQTPSGATPTITRRKRGLLEGIF